jgi:hypothetical protein
VEGRGEPRWVALEIRIASFFLKRERACLQKAIHTRKVGDVLRLKAGGLSKRKIAAGIGVSARPAQRGRPAGLGRLVSGGRFHEVLERRLYPRCPTAAKDCLNPIGRHRELKRPGVCYGKSIVRFTPWQAVIFTASRLSSGKAALRARFSDGKKTLGPEHPYTNHVRSALFDGRCRRLP